MLRRLRLQRIAKLELILAMTVYVCVGVRLLHATGLGFSKGPMSGRGASVRSKRH